MAHYRLVAKGGGGGVSDLQTAYNGGPAITDADIQIPLGPNAEFTIFQNHNYPNTIVENAHGLSVADAGTSLEMLFVHQHSSTPVSGRILTFLAAQNGASPPTAATLSVGWSDSGGAYKRQYEVGNIMGDGSTRFNVYGSTDSTGAWIVLNRTEFGSDTYASLQLTSDLAGDDIGYPGDAPAFRVWNGFSTVPLTFRHRSGNDAAGNTLFSLCYDKTAYTADTTNNFTHTSFDVRKTGNASTAVASISTHGDLQCNGRYNGQAMEFKTLTELTTIAAAAFTDTAIQAPDRSIVFAVTTRVVTVIPTATTYDVGHSSNSTAFASGVSTAAGTTDEGTDSGGVPATAGAMAARITPNLTPASATGQVRVTIHYAQFTPATA